MILFIAGFLGGAVAVYAFAIKLQIDLVCFRVKVGESSMKENSFNDSIIAGFLGGAVAVYAFRR